MPVKKKRASVATAKRKLESFLWNEHGAKAGPPLDVEDVFADAGTVDRLDYIADKDGKPAIYTHEFKRKPKLWISATGRQILITGLRITERGIET